MKTEKMNIPMLVAVVLLCLTLLSSHLTSSLYARYTTVITAQDHTRIAGFRIETDLDYITLGIADGGTPTLVLDGAEDEVSAQLPFYIESRSEVTTAYSVTVDFGTALPVYLTVTLSNGTKTQSIHADGVQSVFTFTDFGGIQSFSGSDTDPSVREELVLSLSVADAAAITAEVSISDAKLTVKVDQTDG